MQKILVLRHGCLFLSIMLIHPATFMMIIFMTHHQTVYSEFGIDISNGVTATNCVYV